MKEVIGSKSFDKYFNRTTEDKEKLLVLFYHSKWCNQHREHEIHLRESLESCNERVIMIDTLKEENKIICSTFKIDTVPSLLVIKEGKVKKRIIGYNHDDIEQFFGLNEKRDEKQEKKETKEKKQNTKKKEKSRELKESREKHEKKHSKKHKVKENKSEERSVETKSKKHHGHRDHGVHRDHREQRVMKEPERNIDREINEKKKELKRKKKNLKKEIKNKRVDVTLSDSDDSFKKFNYSSDSSD